MSNATLNRRQFITAALGITGALGLAACGSSATAGNSGATSSSAGSSSASTSSLMATLFWALTRTSRPTATWVTTVPTPASTSTSPRPSATARAGSSCPRPSPRDAKDTLLNSGQITCIWNGFTIEGREDGYAFTDPYMENRQVVVVPASSDVQQLSDLAGKNVITQADSAALDVLSEGGSQEELGKSFGNLQTIDNYNTAFMMLESGQVDAIAIDYPVAIFNIGDKTSEFRILDENLNSEHFGVGFAKTDDGAQLAKTVEADLQALDSEGTVKELCEKYADQGVSYDLWCLPKA